MPAASAFSVDSMSASSAGLGVPTMKLIAASPVHPSSSAPKSMLTRSPSASR
jgi:hypothetical protein